jgi:hypothetical protein
MSRPPTIPSEAWASGDTDGHDLAPGSAGQVANWEPAPPLSLGQVAPRPGSAAATLRRYSGPRAELGTARARLRHAVETGDTAAEAEAARELARLLVQRGMECGTAVGLGERSLAIREDARLREELAGWYRGLGQWALAAATLRPLLASASGERRARLLVRIAALLGRAGDAAGVLSALLVAQGEDPLDAVPPELIGCLGGWAPKVVEPAQAAQAFLVAARRRAARGERAAAFEDMLRALESAPDDRAAAEELAGALGARARHVAADEVRREHARALGAAGRSIHAQTVELGARAGDWARALGAALDADWDADFDLEAALRAVGLTEADAEHPRFDELAERVGLHQLVAGRLEILADAGEPRERSRAHLALGRLWAGPLGDLERAIDAWLESLLLLPERGEALAQLGAVGSASVDQSPLVEALVRVGAEIDRECTAETVACVRELCRMVADGPGDPAPIVWISRRLQARGETDAEIVELGARFAPLVELEAASLERARERLRHAQGPERVAALRQLATLLRGRTDECEAYLAVLEELVRVLPGEAEWQHALWRALRRPGHEEGRQAALGRAAESAFSPVDRVRARLELARLRHGLGDTPSAVETLRPMLGDPAAQTAGWSRALCYAARSGDRRWRANALLALAVPLAPQVRAELACVAAEDLLGLGEFEAARSAAEQALNADPSARRAVVTLGRISARMRAPDAAALIERALGEVAPRAWLCQALADTCVAQGEPMLAFTWTQRWLSLGPGNLEAVRALLVRACAAADAERIEQAIAWVLSQPLPTARYAVAVADALRRVGELDPERALAAARRVLDTVGPTDDALREAVVAVAKRAGDSALVAVTLERALAPETVPKLLQHAEELARLGQLAHAERALARALTLGADPAAVLARQAAELPADPPDAILDALETRTRVLGSIGKSSTGEMIQAWREYGAALWDLADDRAGASAAWREAAALDPEHGLEQLLADLATFGGIDAALEEIDRTTQSGEHVAELPRLLSFGAELAARADRASLGLELAERALDLDPSRADALAVAESVAGPREAEALCRIYQRLAGAALGRFGERAAHYRGARQLELRGSGTLAFDHALGAFEAIPAAGVTFLLLAKLGRETGRIGEVVRAVERVAEKAPDAATRSAWLELVARHTGDSEEGLQQRCRALLAALGAEPNAVTVVALGEALGALTAVDPEQREVLGARVQRALTAMSPRLAGPEGARTAVAAATLLLDFGRDAEAAVAAVERAARSDASVDEYVRLVPRAVELGRARDAVRELLDLVLQLGRDPYGNAGRALCELGCELGEVLGDRRTSAELGLMALERDPDDLALVRRVEQAVLGVDDPALRALWFETVPPARRAEALFELGARRKEQGDSAGSVEAFRRALATPGLGDAERRDGLEQLEGLFSLHGRAEALGRLLEFAVDPRERIPWLRELGRLLAETDAGASVRRYAELLALEPGDEEAIAALERDAERRGDYEAFAELLGRQAALATDVEERRRYVLRRALVLEQKLAERDQARLELDELLAETGDDLPVLRAFAELEVRGARPALAAELWLRASRLASDEREVEELGRRACDAWLAAGEPERARLATRSLRARLGAQGALKLTVEVERKIGKSPELAQALEDCAHVLPEGDEQRAALLVEAARMAEAGGDSTKALARAREAAALDPAAPGPGLIAELLAYRQQGVGEQADAVRTVAVLEGFRGTLSPAQAELRAFLLAEALAVAEGPDRARTELERAIGECGPRPLIAARLAEELARRGEDLAALPLFEAALAGDVRGLRSRGKIATLGAIAAERAGDLERALAWVVIGGEDPEMRDHARAVEREIRAALEARSQVVAPSPPSSSPIGVIRRAPREVVEAGVGPPRRPTLPAFPPTDETEARLVGELANGSAEAGLEIVARLEHRPNRAHDLLGACRQLSNLVPGDPEVLGCLVKAATADHSHVFAQAVEHARRSFSPDEPPLAPPPLGEQREQPDRVRNLLVRDLDAAGEALGLMWEHASQVFRRDPMAYGVTGLERIPPGAPTPLGRLFAAATRLLGASRTPLFQRRDTAEVTLSVALLSPAAVLLAGEVRRESPELAFHLGAMLAAAAPERVLLFGSSPEQARDILGALLVGFGPPASPRRGQTASTNLAEVLWQSIPARAQRRLRELGDEPGAFEYEPAMASARRAVRRAGLLVCGDLGVAVRETLGDLGFSAPPPEAGTLASLAARFPDVGDLVRLATSPEYAEARWQPGRAHP